MGGVGGSKAREHGGEDERIVEDEDKNGKKKKKKLNPRVTVVTFHYSASHPQSHADKLFGLGGLKETAASQKMCWKTISKWGSNNVMQHTSVHLEFSLRFQNELRVTAEEVKVE